MSGIIAESDIVEIGIIQRKFIAISASKNSSFGILPDWTVVGIGSTVYNKVADASLWSDIILLSRGASDHILGLYSGGTVVGAGRDTHSQVSGVSGWTGITDLAVGELHSLGIKTGGTVEACGFDFSGQVSGVSGWTNITKIAAGTAHSIGLESGGTVVGAGSNASGQTAVSGWSGIIDVGCGPDFTIGLQSDGTVVYAGLDVGSQGTALSALSGIVAFSVGWYHTIATNINEESVGCGDSFESINWTEVLRTSSGSNHSLMQKIDGTVIGFGDNAYGQLDLDGEA